MTDNNTLIRTRRFDYDPHLAIWRKTRLAIWRKPHYAGVARLTAGISKAELLPSILPCMPFNPDRVDPKDAAGFRFPETMFGVLFGDRTGTEEE